jgi:hypothetical protein
MYSPDADAKSFVVFENLRASRRLVPDGWRSQCPPLQQPACRLSFVERES